MSANTTTTAINVAYPDTNGLNLKIGLGGCKLKVKPGDSGAWVSGTYQDPNGALPPRIDQDGGTVRITQDYHIADVFNLINGAPRIDLALGKAKPYPLTVEMGASDSSFDLGGLPITRLTVKQGAGKCEFDFSAQNPQPMSLLTVDAGAMNLEMKNLANANFAEMNVSGGAAGSVQVGESRAGQAIHSGYLHRRQLACGPRDAVGEPAQAGRVQAHGFGHG